MSNGMWGGLKVFGCRGSQLGDRQVDLPGRAPIHGVFIDHHPRNRELTPSWDDVLSHGRAESSDGGFPERTV